MSQRIENLWDRIDLVDETPVHSLMSLDPVPESAPRVVLVHGLTLSSRYMVPTALCLSPFCRVHAPDLPGFGKSAKPHRVLDISELADALAGWVRVVGLRQAAFIANSMGCQIVADLAVRYPELVERAVFVGPTVDPKARGLIQQAARWLVDSTREPLSLMPILVGDYISAGLRRTLRTVQFMLRDRIEDKLPHVYAPTMVVRGSRDPIVSQDWAEKAVRLLPHGQLAVIQGAPHTVNYAAPGELVRVVQPFLLQGREWTGRALSA